MKSHLISQVVLTEFTNESGELIEIDKATGISKLETPANVCYQEIDRVIIKELEDSWANGVEDDAKKALNTLHKSNVLLTEKHVNTLKRLIALHFVRSIVYELVEASSPQMEVALENLKKEYVRQYPQSKTEIENAYSYDNNEKMKMAVRVMGEQIPKIESYLANKEFGLEIGVAPPNCYFIIGDIPVLSVDKKGNMGVLQGVSITDAQGLAMPLSPTHIASIKTNPTETKYIKLTFEQVTSANKKLHSLSLSKYYRLPK